MKVYVVTGNNNFRIAGVFASKELADKYINDLCNEYVRLKVRHYELTIRRDMSLPGWYNDANEIDEIEMKLVDYGDLNTYIVEEHEIQE